MYRTAFAAAAAAALALVLAGCGGAGQHTGIDAAAITRAGKPAPPPAASKIAFRVTGVKVGLYTVGEDGTGRAAVNTGQSGAVRWPAWSRAPVNGKFMLAATGGNCLYVMNADGTGRRVLRNLGADMPCMPCWSPDGTEISYLVSNDGMPGPVPHGYLHIVNVATGQDTPVVNPTTRVPVFANAPAWSRAKPDRIVYSWGGTLPEQGPPGLFVISRAAPGQPWSDPVRIVVPEEPAYYITPAAWSPVVDGKSWFIWRFASKLYRAPVDGATGLPDTTQWQGVALVKDLEGTFTISPDATRVCYRGSDYCLVVMDVVTGATSLLMPTERDPSGESPDWSPWLN